MSNRHFLSSPVDQRGRVNRGDVSVPLRRQRSIDFTVTGLVFCTIMSFMGIAASNIQANLLVAIFGLMVGIIMLCYAISRINLRKLSIRRIMPEHGVVGTVATIRYEIHNRKRLWPSLAVTLAELDGTEAFAAQPAGFLLHGPAKSTVIMESDVMVRRRGIYQLDRYQAGTCFPLGFIKRSFIRHGRDAMLNYPALGRVNERLIRMCRPAEGAALRMRPLRGGTDEFYGVKEYQAGENPRLIYWRRSARTGTLVTKEMSHVAPPQILLLVDTHVPQGSSATPADIERAIGMAGSLASEAMEQGLLVGLVAWSDHWVNIAPNRGKRHRRDLLTALARLTRNADRDQDLLLEEAHGQRRSGMTLVVLTTSPARQTLANSARGGQIFLSTADPWASGLFKFEESVDFDQCAPQSEERGMT